MRGAGEYCCSRPDAGSTQYSRSSVMRGALAALVYAGETSTQVSETPFEFTAAVRIRSGATLPTTGQKTALRSVCSRSGIELCGASSHTLPPTITRESEKLPNRTVQLQSCPENQVSSSCPSP